MPGKASQHLVLSQVTAVVLIKTRKRQCPRSSQGRQGKRGSPHQRETVCFSFQSTQDTFPNIQTYSSKLSFYLNPHYSFLLRYKTRPHLHSSRHLLQNHFSHELTPMTWFRDWTWNSAGLQRTEEGFLFTRPHLPAIRRCDVSVRSNRMCWIPFREVWPSIWI